MSNKVDSLEVIIIGGGLAALTTAALLARSGKVVTLFERASKEMGGCTRTEEVDGFYLIKDHMLYVSLTRPTQF